MKKFNNQHLRVDLRKMKHLNIQIVVKAIFIPRLKRSFGIDVSDSGYFYNIESERDEDFNKLRKIK